MVDETAIRTEKTRVALISIFAAVTLTALKVLVGLFTGSLGILAEAAHSGLDLIAAIITFFAVRIADKPADREHLYGHGKVENLSAFIASLLLILTCGLIIYEALQKLFVKAFGIEVTVWSFAVLVFAILVDYWRSRALYRTARKFKSQALEADALHFSTDIWSSSVVIVGLVGAWLGYPKADAIAAFAVAILVITVTLRLLKRTVDALMDRVPEGLYAKVKETVENVDGVERASHLRMRQAGSRTFIDMSVDIPRTIPFELAHEVINRVEKSIRQLVQDADIVIHPEPVVAKGESVADKVRMIAVEAGARTHNIYAHKIGQRYYVDLHLEYRDTKGFEDAHRVATVVEEQILQMMPEVGKVKIHIDEPSEVVLVSKDITASSLHIVKRMRDMAMDQDGIEDCNDLTVIDMGNGKIKVVMTCIFDNGLSFDEVHHLVTDVENRIYQQLSQVFKVVIHAEPISL